MGVAVQWSGQMSDQQDLERTTAGCPEGSGHDESVRVANSDLAEIKIRVDGILSLFEAKLKCDASKQQTIERLYSQLEDQRDKLEARAARSYIFGMIQHHAEIGKLIRAVRSMDEVDLPPEKIRELLESLQRDMELLLGAGSVASRAGGEPRPGSEARERGVVDPAVFGGEDKGSGTREGAEEGGDGVDEVDAGTTAAGAVTDIGAAKINEVVKVVRMILGEFKKKVKYDASKEETIDRLNHALRRHEEKLAKLVTPPYRSATIRHRAEIRRRLEWCERGDGAQGAADGGGEELSRQFCDLLEDLRRDVEDRLDLSGVTLYDAKPGERYDPVRHMLAGRAIFTDDDRRSGTIADSIGPGFDYEGNVFVRARVRVYSVQGAKTSC